MLLSGNMQVLPLIFADCCFIFRTGKGEMVVNLMIINFLIR